MLKRIESTKLKENDEATPDDAMPPIDSIVKAKLGLTWFGIGIRKVFSSTIRLPSLSRKSFNSITRKSESAAIDTLSGSAKFSVNYTDFSLISPNSYVNWSYAGSVYPLGSMQKVAPFEILLLGPGLPRIPSNSLTMQWQLLESFSVLQLTYG